MVKFLEIVPCHRMKERSITIRGYTFPLCARCMSILIGYLFFPILLLVPSLIPLWIGVLLNIPMILDGWTQKQGYRKSNNTLRVITGLLCGLGQSIIIVDSTTFLVHILT
ncbi:DUF2085 domain-containing protein [Priestia filamentosa]|uniref:DUF2085 domain-containing protein n=1 Tax=Priestia filamentosa TaxID=1402861 RepID=UPI00398280EA